MSDSRDAEAQFVSLCHPGSLGALVSALPPGPTVTGRLGSGTVPGSMADPPRLLKVLPPRDPHRFHPDSTGRSKSRDRGVRSHRVSTGSEKPSNVSSPTDRTEGGETPSMGDHSSLASPRTCVSGWGTVRAQPMAPEALCDLDTCCP